MKVIRNMPRDKKWRNQDSSPNYPTDFRDLNTAKFSKLYACQSSFSDIIFLVHVTHTLSYVQIKHLHFPYAYSIFREPFSLLGIPHFSYFPITKLKSNGISPIKPFQNFKKQLIPFPLNIPHHVLHSVTCGN